MDFEGRGLVAIVVCIMVLFFPMGSSLQAQEGMVFKDKALHKRVVKVIDALEDEALGKKLLKAIEIIGDEAVVNELLKFWEKKGIDLCEVDVPLLMKVEDKTVQKAAEIFSDEELKRLMKDVAFLLKIAVTAPEGSAWVEYCRKRTFPEVERVTNGLIRVKMFTGGVMGVEADIIRKMKMKQLHGVGVANFGLTMMIPEMCVMELPFLFDYEPELYYNGKFCEVDYIQEKLQNSMAKLAEKRELQYLGFPGGMFDHFTSKIPIKSMEDFAKIKSYIFRGDLIMPHIFKVFGFKRTASTEIYTIASMLSTGLIDSAGASWYMSVVLQWWPHVRYVTDYPVRGYVSTSVVFDRRVIDRLATLCDMWGQWFGLKDGRTVVRKVLEVTDTTLDEMRFGVRRNEAKAREGLIKRGAIEEVHFPEEELEKLRQKVLPLYDKLADKLYPRWFLDEILRYREEYRKLKAEGKLTDDWYERGIIPDGDQCDQWRTEWGG